GGWGGGPGGGPGVVSGGGTGILVVTVLTSHTAADLGVTLGREAPEVGAEVIRLAGVAHVAGAHGVVCSGHEVAAVRSTYPGLHPLVPGIRLPGGAAHDQARITTPERAAADGAAYLVLGRAVTEAAAPAAVLRGIRETLRVR
ncbi:MAG: orotidine 5'-phosphate decarboxylase / HUMPS family protein, partial [Gemmatimonadaceae bacterium]